MRPRTAPAERLPANEPGGRAKKLRRAWPALPALAVVLFLLLRLGFDQGGYFPAAFTSAAVIAFIALAALLACPGRLHCSTPALVAVGALTAYACWTGLSWAWSVVPDVPLLDARRAMLYVALFALALLAAGSACTARALVWCVLGVIGVVVGAGLLSRLQPDLVSAAVDEPTWLGLPLDVVLPYRLSHPLQYWNAFGALASVGAALAIGLAADARGAGALRPVAAACAVLLIVAMYLSLSRGAWLALAFGVLVLLLIAPHRGSLLLTLVLAGGAAILAILRLHAYPALVVDPQAGSGQATQGNAFTRELLALVVLCAAGQAAVVATRVTDIGERMRRARKSMLIAAGILVLVSAVAANVASGGEAARGAVAAVGDATGWVDRQRRDFLVPSIRDIEGTERLSTLEGARSELYRVAIAGFKAHPLIGEGAGSFEVRFTRERVIDATARDAHSLPLQTMSELGAVGMLFLLGFVGAVATAARRARAGGVAIRSAEAAAVTAAFAVWIAHSCIDWDWEMPALTATALVLSATLFSPPARSPQAAAATGASALRSPPLPGGGGSAPAAQEA